MVFKILNKLTFLFTIILFAFSIKAEKTEAEYFNQSHVFFEVQKLEKGLELVERESGVEKFRTLIEDASFERFSEFSSNNFYVRRLEQELYWQYQSAQGEFFEILVKQTGDILLLNSPQTYTGFDRSKTYAFKTNGILENHGSQAFHFLVARAEQIHNFGTIQTHSMQLFQHYLFNSGVIKIGKTPTAVVDLRDNLAPLSAALPSYKKSIVENYGKFISECKLNIKGPLSYHEHNTSSIKDLEMQNGDIRVEKEVMAIEGTLSGNVKTLSVKKDSIFYAGKIVLDSLQNLDIEEGGILHLKEDSSLFVRETYSHKGDISCGSSLNLHVGSGLSSTQTGTILTPGTLNTDVERRETPKQKLDSPSLLSDPAINKYINGKAPKVDYRTKTAPADLASPELQRLKEAYYARIGYKEDPTPLFSPGAMLSKTIKQIIYTDYYLNTITYHYENGRLVNVTETGYIWQRRTKEEREKTIFETLPPEAIQALSARDKIGEKTKAKLDFYAQILEALQKDQALRDQDYYSRLLKALKEATVSNADIYTLLRDPDFSLLRDWNKISDEDQENIAQKAPEIANLADIIDNSREIVEERLRRALDSPVQRFINDIAIPIITIGSIIAGDCLFPEMVPATAPALVASCTKLASLMGRVATGMGIEVLYKQINTFLKKTFNEDKAKTSTSGDRIQNTPQDADKYLSGLQSQKGLLGKKQISTDGREYYEFMQKTEYKGVRFRKGDYISRDQLHHEIEWFRGAKMHRGAIDPKTGELYKGGEPSRILKIK
jgi:hypothetical protein